jgi:hypothetical protein
VGLPVRFAAPDSQRQGCGRVSSDMLVRAGGTDSKIPEDWPQASICIPNMACAPIWARTAFTRDPASSALRRLTPARRTAARFRSGKGRMQTPRGLFYQADFLPDLIETTARLTFVWPPGCAAAG